MAWFGWLPGVLGIPPLGPQGPKVVHPIPLSDCCHLTETGTLSVSPACLMGDGFSPRLWWDAFQGQRQPAHRVGVIGQGQV